MPSKNQTVTNVAEPWKAVQPMLESGAQAAQGLYNSGGFASPAYTGDRVAGFGDTSSQAQRMVMDQAAGGTPMTETASGTLSNMMNPEYQSAALDQVKQNALGTAIPAATAMFSGSGMTNGSAAMDTVGRAATEAVAPYEYDAFNQSQGRALSAAGMAPQMDQAGYMPAQMVAGVGGAQDALSQANLDANMAQFYENRDAPKNEMNSYLSTLMGLGGMGGTNSQTQPGLSTAAKLGGGLTTGLGTYGSLAAAGLGGPIGIGGGLLAGLLGAFG